MTLPFGRPIAQSTFTFGTLLAVYSGSCDVRLQTGSLARNVGRIEGLTLTAGKRVVLLWDDPLHRWLVLAVIEESL